MCGEKHSKPTCLREVEEVFGRSKRVRCYLPFEISHRTENIRLFEVKVDVPLEFVRLEQVAVFWAQSVDYGRRGAVGHSRVD